jgi:hypothetical protein
MTSLSRKLLTATIGRLRKARSALTRKLGFHTRPYQQLQRLLSSYGAELPPEVLVLGDSVAERVSRDDADTRPLWKMLADALQPLRTCAVTHSAYHAEIYRSLCAVLTRTRDRPEFVVIPINVRSFLPQWLLSPAYQFKEEMAAIEAWLANPHAKLKQVTFPPVVSAPAEAEFMNQRIDCIGSEFQRVGDFVNLIRTPPHSPTEEFRRRRIIFEFHYMQLVDKDHPRVAALREAVEVAEGLGARVVSYMTPINHQGGVRHCGRAFSDVLNRNVATLQEALAPRPILDLSGAFSADRFFHVDEPTEHLNQLGRLELATHVADELRKRQQSGHYKPAPNLATSSSA